VHFVDYLYIFGYKYSVLASKLQHPVLLRKKCQYCCSEKHLLLVLRIVVKINIETAQYI